MKRSVYAIEMRRRLRVQYILCRTEGTIVDYWWVKLTFRWVIGPVALLKYEDRLVLCLGLYKWRKRRGYRWSGYRYWRKWDLWNIRL